MTFALGMLGLVQTTWLPGWCLVRIWRLDRCGPAMLLAFALSQIVNYFLVQALHQLGLYNRGVLLAVVALEALVAWRVGREVWRRPVADYLAAIAGFLRAVLALGRGSLAARLLVVLVAVCATFYLVAWALEIGRVFRGWDDVQAWNRWAIEWATGSFTSARGFYPHLMPINWSIIYVLAGDTRMEIFPKAVMPAYAALMLYLMVWRAVRAGDAAQLAGAVFLAAAIPLTISVIFLYGYADVPAAFFGLLAVHCALEADRAEDPVAAMLLAAVLAAGASLTKASGLIPAACVLLLIARAQGARRFAWAALIIAVLTLPHYVSRGVEQFARLEGLAPQERLLQLTGLGTGGAPDFIAKGIGARVLDSATMLVWPEVLEKLADRAPGAVGRSVVQALRCAVALGALASLILVVAAAGNPLWRPVHLIVLLPYGLIWAANFGYDARNLLPALSIAALCLADGVRRIEAGLVRRRPRH